jgi:hypothetical protein
MTQMTVLMHSYNILNRQGVITQKQFAITQKRYSIKAFVAHVERPRYVGGFEERINNVIANCRYFILLINIDTLGRQRMQNGLS